MADRKKIKLYLEQIKQLHLNEIHDPYDILTALLQSYLSQKNLHHSFSLKSGVLFGNNAPYVFAKRLLHQIQAETQISADFFNKINDALTRHFNYKHYKKNGDFASLWVAFLYYYHPILPEFKENSFFKEAIIIGNLIRDEIKKNHVKEFLDDIDTNNYHKPLSENNNRLVSIIKVCGTNWIKPDFHDRLIHLLMRLPYWDDENIENCRENTMVAISTLETLIPGDMIQDFYTEILSNLADDIENIQYKTLLSISKIPFNNIEDQKIIKNLIDIIDHSNIYDEYSDEDTSEYRSCTILEILLKITKEKSIHEIIFKKISELLDSDQDNSVETLLQNISIPENYKKIYIYKLLNNLKHKRRCRFDTTETLNMLIETEEDRNAYFNTLLNLLVKKHCLNSISGIKSIQLSTDKQKELLVVIMDLLKGNSAYLGVEIIRAVKFDIKLSYKLLNTLRPLLQGDHRCSIVDAMRYLPFTIEDNDEMALALMKELETDQEFYAIHLLSKIPLPYHLQSQTLIALFNRIKDDDIIASQAILTLSHIHKYTNIFCHINQDTFTTKLAEKLSNPQFTSCIERICHALPHFNFSTAYCKKLLPELLNILNSRDSVMSKSALFALSRIKLSNQHNIDITLSLLSKINKGANHCHHTSVIIENIETLISHISKHFSTTKQIGLISIIEEKLKENFLISDHIIARVITGIKLEETLQERHNLPLEMVKQIFHFI